jgi:hypothetical protein
MTSMQLTLSVNPVLHVYLQDLVRTGLFGKNPSEAAERLVELGVRDNLEKNVLKKK